MDLNRFRRSVAKFFLGNSLPIADTWGWKTPGKWTKLDYIEQYERVVYAVVSAIAEDAAKMTFTAMKANKPLASHPFIQLIAMPNPEMSQFQFLEFHFTYMKLMGESFWYLVKGKNSKKPKEIYLLNPAKVEVAFDKDTGDISGYTLKKSNGEKIPFEVDEIVHFKMPNPANPYRGYGTVAAAKDYIETEQFATGWTKNSIYNSGRPSGIINIMGTISDAEFASVKQQYKDQYSGTSNAGKTMFLKGADGINYQKLGMELGEVALGELKNMTRDDIMMVFRVSKTMLGISDDVNRANAQENHAVFIENVIKPECDRFIDHVNAFLIPLWGDGVIIGYEDMTAATQEDKLALIKGATESFTMTTNEKRQILDLDPLPGGDVIPVPINYIPLDVAPPPTKRLRKLKKTKKKELNDKVNLFIEQFFGNQVLWENRYKSFMQKEFNIQLKEILSKHTKQDLPEWLFNVDASQQRIAGGLNPMGIELLREAAKFALDLADDTDTQFQINERVRNYIHDRVNKLAIATSDQSVKMIEDTIAQGVANGESIAELRNRIKEVYKYADTVRAERIARTETLAASNEGANEAYRQSPLVRYKEWSAEPDACPSCASLDGKIVGLDEEFATLGGEVNEIVVNYTDIDTPPLHPNCRCAILPVAE